MCPSIKRNLSPGELTFGGHPYGNQLVRKGLGGSGGGSVKIFAQNVDIDGRINTDGAAPHMSHGEGAGRLWNCCRHQQGPLSMTVFAGIDTGLRSTTVPNLRVLLALCHNCSVPSLQLQRLSQNQAKLSACSCFPACTIISRQKKLLVLLILNGNSPVFLDPDHAQM